MDADAAERLGRRLKRFADEAVYWPVDWNRHDLLSAMEVARSAPGTSALFTVPSFRTFCGLACGFIAAGGAADGVRDAGRGGPCPVLAA